nr:nucleosome assembly protein 1;3-like [Ipomoea trifida]
MSNPSSSNPNPSPAMNSDEDRVDASATRIPRNQLLSFAKGPGETFQSRPNSSTQVQRRLIALREIQNKHDEFEVEYSKEKAALNAKYQKIYYPLYDKRFRIVSGADEVEDSFKIDFFFEKSNPFFSNPVLTKTYYMFDDEILLRTRGSMIEWYPGKSLTANTTRKKVAERAVVLSAKNKEPMTESEEESFSFFNFFRPLEVLSADHPDSSIRFLALVQSFNYMVGNGEPRQNARRWEKQPDTRDSCFVFVFDSDFASVPVVLSLPLLAFHNRDCASC